MSGYYEEDENMIEEGYEDKLTENINSWQLYAFTKTEGFFYVYYN